MQLKLSSISKKFDNKIILEDASFTFERGKIYGLLGRNGAGKTTLFNCIARNLTLNSGSIQFVEREELIDYDNTDIGFTQTYPQLPAFMTAYEFVRFYMDIHKDKHKYPRSPEE